MIEILYSLMFFDQRFVIMQRLNVNLTSFFILKQMSKRKNKIRFWNIIFEITLTRSKRIKQIYCRWQNLFITISRMHLSMRYRFI